MSDKSPTATIVATTACLLGYLTSILLPAISNGAADWEEALPAIALFELGTLVCLALVVKARGKPDRLWLLPTALVAAWGVLGGGITMLSSYSALQFQQGQIEQIQLRSSQGARKDEKGQTLPTHIQDQVQDQLRQSLESAKRHLKESRIGLYLGGLLLLGGVAATGAVTFLLLRKPTASAEPNAPATGGA
jgi:hypothetical protein